MSTRRKFIAGIGALLAAGVVAAAGAWYFVIRTDSPPPVSLAGAVQAVRASTSTEGMSTSDASAADLAGTWTVVQGANSFVGYRVDEQLAGVGAVTAVGRTTAIQGSLSFDGSAITATNITADVSKLASDKSQRDGALRMQALESAKYPNATFALTSPISISELPDDGETVTQTINGKLTLHGVTREVSMQVQGVLDGNQLVVVGTTNIAFADYGIAKPQSMAVLSIDDHGTMELQLVFARQA
jgi:polyisoprenoid-binding protein YceI